MTTDSDTDSDTTINANTTDKLKDGILNAFALPIEYTKFKNVSSSIITDLELDTSNNAYSIVFNGTSSALGNIIEKKWKYYYSNNRKFLRKQQKWLRSISNAEPQTTQDVQNATQTINAYYSKWRELKQQTNFLTTYQYIDWSHLSFLNKHPIFLQAMTYFNIASPALHILFPIILLLIPFFLIKLIMRIPFTIDTYKHILGKTFQNHAFGKLFTAFCSPQCSAIDMNTKVYAAVSFALYIFTFYQNILSCIKFYNNTCLIHEFMYDTKEYIRNCNILYEFSVKHKGTQFKQFHAKCEEQLISLRECEKQLDCVEQSSFTVYQTGNIGTIMYMFHEIYYNQNIEDCFSYWFGYAGYIENMIGLSQTIKKNVVNYATLTSFSQKKNMKQRKPSQQYIKQQYYIYQLRNTHADSHPHADSSMSTSTIVKNDIDLLKNSIITGPNASGKTTILKATLMNILFTQQFGIGCYESCTIHPYASLFSYINIPDTSERDSLFQAEARRCLYILDYIDSHPNDRVFCIFDELFSGTNPYEAQKSARAYLKYLHKRNATYMLTTHFNDLKEIKNSACNQLYMEVLVNGDAFKYSYRLKHGTSNVYGGFKVLKNLGFPQTIVRDLEK